MGQQAWATKEQVVWLESRLSLFLAATDTKARRIFWKDIYRDWFATYLLTSNTEAELVDAQSSTEDVSSSNQTKKEKVSKFVRTLSVFLIPHAADLPLVF